MTIGIATCHKSSTTTACFQLGRTRPLFVCLVSIRFTTLVSPVIRAFEAQCLDWWFAPCADRDTRWISARSRGSLPPLPYPLLQQNQGQILNPRLLLRTLKKTWRWARQRRRLMANFPGRSAGRNRYRATTGSLALEKAKKDFGFFLNSKFLYKPWWALNFYFSCTFKKKQKPLVKCLLIKTRPSKPFLRQKNKTHISSSQSINQQVIN